MTPLMYLLAGTIREAPQRTHPWNNRKLSRDAVRDLDPLRLVLSKGDPKASKAWWGIFPLFHAPIFGGWREYIVIAPVRPDVTCWHIGWITPSVRGVSRIPLSDPARVLRGDKDAEFFAVDQYGHQIEIKEIGSGRIGKGGVFSKLTLL